MTLLRRFIRPDLFAVAALALAAIGCDKPIVAESNTAQVGGIEVTLGDLQTRYLEVTDGTNTYEYPQPALVIPVTLKNLGPGDFSYSPSASTQQMTEAQTPLLYADPGPEADLPPESKTLINGVYLEKGALEGQVRSGTTIAEGESLTDLFLFEVPDEANRDLILSIPPSMHRGKFPLLFRVKYAPEEALGPKVYPQGEPAQLDVAEFTVTGTEVAYVKTNDSAQGEGFSSDPLLKVNFEIENTSQQPITYDPSHRDLGVRGAALFGKGETYKRVKFTATTSVVGQKSDPVEIPPGGSVQDFVLFERPPKDASQLSFEYPAKLFGGTGIVRVRLDYEYAEPPLPKELEKKPATPSADGG